MSPPGVRRAVVVGAGSAGLATAAALQDAGLAVTVLEEGARSGASWAARYRSLRLNTIRALSGLPGYEIPRRYGDWVSGADFAEYLDDYAHHNRLDLRVGTRALNVEHRAAGWRVDTVDGPLDCDVVVVATGCSARPVVPEWAAAFTGRFMHAAAYRSPDDVSGQTVLIVGSGNSATEIATELSRRELYVRVSVRTAPLLVKSVQMGISVHRLSVVGARLPDWLWDASSLAGHRMLYRDLAQHGLGTPDLGSHSRFRVSGTPPVAERGFADAIRRGSIGIVAAVTGAEGDAVELSDGTALRPDTLILATGYRPSYSSLLDGLDVLDDHGRPFAWGGPLAGSPGLFVVGGASLQGDLREHGLEAARVARAVQRSAGDTAAAPT